MPRRSHLPSFMLLRVGSGIFMDIDTEPHVSAPVTVVFGNGHQRGHCAIVRAGGGYIHDYLRSEGVARYSSIVDAWGVQTHKVDLQRVERKWV